MKSMFLSVVIICALAISALGGTFATWSDSETSWGNYIETGSVDLKVNGEDDEPWGEGVDVKVDIECMVPCKWYGPFEVELWNAGQCEDASRAYIHLKNMVCSNILPKVHPVTGETTGYADPSTDQPYSGDLKPEPELVAEYGGWVDSVYVTGIGAEGDDCSMGTHVDMCITTDMVDPSTVGFANVLVNPDGVILRDKLGKWDCKELYLFDLEPCEPRTIYLWFHLQQFNEDAYGDFIADPGEEGYDELHWKKFNDWPSWSMMKDRVDFDLEFDLWLVDP